MGDLERLFLGTMMVTGLLILGLFGLYFDLGDMVAGSFGRAGPTFSQDLDLIRERRRASYGQKKKPLMTSGGLGGPGPSRPSSEPDYSRLIIRRPQPSRQELIDREIRRLQRKGHIDEEYIQMRALYQVDRSLIPVFDVYDRLVAEGDPERAVEVLEQAIEDLDEENLYARRDALRYLYQAFIQSGRDTSATDTLRRMTLLSEQILAIEDRAEQHRDQSGQEYVQKMREGFALAKRSLDLMDQYPEEGEKMWSQQYEDARAGKPRIRVQGGAQALRAQLLQKGMSPEQVQEQMSRFDVDLIDVTADF